MWILSVSVGLTVWRHVHRALSIVFWGVYYCVSVWVLSVCVGLVSRVSLGLHLRCGHWLDLTACTEQWICNTIRYEWSLCIPLVEPCLRWHWQCRCGWGNHLVRCFSKSTFWFCVSHFTMRTFWKSSHAFILRRMQVLPEGLCCITPVTEHPVHLFTSSLDTACVYSVLCIPLHLLSSCAKGVWSCTTGLKLVKKGMF